MLRDQFPPFYLSSGMIMNLFEVEDNELQLIKEGIDSAYNQFFIDTADESIDLWEKEYGLPKSSLPLEQRRATIKSKMRGYGTVTVSHLKNVCDAYTNGNVDIIEKPSTFEFEIKFTAIKGIPPNMADLKKVIEQIKPAHLGVTYVYSYLVWDEWDSYNKTWDQIDVLNLTWNELETYKQ